MKSLEPIYFECTEDSHRKFWAIQLIQENSSWILLRKWGRIGTKGQQMEQKFSSEYEAREILERLKNEKLSKGYEPVF